MAPSTSVDPDVEDSPCGLGTTSLHNLVGGEWDVGLQALTLIVTRDLSRRRAPVIEQKKIPFFGTPSIHAAAALLQPLPSRHAGGRVSASIEPQMG